MARAQVETQSMRKGKHGRDANLEVHDGRNRAPRVRRDLPQLGQRVRVRGGRCVAELEACHVHASSH